LTALAPLGALGAAATAATPAAALLLVLLGLLDQLVQVFDDVALDLLRRLARVLVPQALLGLLHPLDDARDQLLVLLRLGVVLTLLALLGVGVGDVLLGLGRAAGLALDVVTGGDTDDEQRGSQQHQ